MPQLRDIATGQTVWFADTAAQEALASGRYELVDGQTATVVTGAGRQVDVPYEKLPEFADTLPVGHEDPFARESRAQEHTEQVRLEREYGGVGGTARAMIEGAASGVSLGLYDVIADWAGFDTEKYARANPNAHLTGEVAGILGSALLPGGQTKLGALLAKTPAGAVTTRSMELGRRIGGVKGLVAAQAAEGAAYGLVQTASGLMITDEPLTAEVVVGELAKNTLFGAGVGAASGAVLGGLSKLGDRLARAADDGIVAPAIDLNSEAGREFTKRVGDAGAEIDIVTDDLLAKHSRAMGEAAVSPTEVREFGKRGKMLRVFGDDVEFAAVEALKHADVGSSADVRLQSLRDQHASLSELGADVLSDLEARGLKIPARALKNRERQMLEAITRANVEPTPANFRAVDKAMGAYRLKLQNVAEQAVGVDVAGRLTQVDQLRAAAKGGPRGVPTMITRAMREQLQAAGYTDEAIRAMKPAEAAEVLGLQVDPVAGLRTKIQTYQKAAVEFDEIGGLSEATLQRIAKNPRGLEPVVNYMTAIRELVDEVGFTVSPQIRESLEGLGAALTGMVRRAPDEAATAAQASRTRLEQARTSLRETLFIEEGRTIRPKHIRAILTMRDPGQQMAAFKALDEYYKAARQFAADMGSPGHAQQIDNAIRVTADTVKGALGNVDLGGLDKGTLAAALGLEVLENMGFDTPIDELVQAAALIKLARGQTRKVVSGEGRVYRLGRAAVARAAARGLPQALRNAGIIPRTNTTGAALMSGGAGATGYWLGGRLMDALSEQRAFGGITASTVSKFRKAIERASTGGRVAISRGPLVAMSLMRSARFGYGEDRDKPDPVDMYQAFKDRASEIAAVAANPLAAQKEIHDQLAPLRQVSAGLADKVEMLSIQVPLYLYSKMPKDPGTMLMFGKSLWRPSELDILRWAEFYKGALAPADVLEEAVRPGGSISPQAARAVRDLYPEMFSKFVSELMQRPDVVEKLDYQQRVRLSVLTDAPLDPSMNPKFVQFVQMQYAEREAAAAQDVPTPGRGGGAPAPEQPTQAQRLLQ